MTPFRSRRINGSRPHRGSFRDRLAYADRSDPLRPLDLVPMRGWSIHDTVRLRALWARSFRRRLFQARKRPWASEGTRCVG